MNILILVLFLNCIVYLNSISTKEMQKKQVKNNKIRKYVYNTKNKYCVNDSIINEVYSDNSKIEEIIIENTENISLLRKRK